MHPTQRKILELGGQFDLKALSLREIGRRIGEPHPQKVKYHMTKLGLLKPAMEERSTKKPGLISIPLLGLANCGQATIIAGEQPEGHLHVSPRILGSQGATEGLFAVQAVGNSMNRADIAGNSIDSGDYVIIDAEYKNFKNGDYVLSMISNLANIKKFTRDDLNRQIVLISESSDYYPPIYIHEDDFENYIATGKVIAVLKRPPASNLDEFVYEKE